MKKTALWFLLVLAGVRTAPALTIRGNSVIWSSVSGQEFVYSVYGKSSGNVMWKKYSVKDGDEETVFHGSSLPPLWSQDGSFIVFSRKNALVLRYTNAEKEHKTASSSIASFDLSKKSDKIVYSDSEKIYMCEPGKNNNYFFTGGSGPQFMDNDRKVLFLDENLKTGVVDEELKSRILLTNIVKKIAAFKSENRFLFLEGNRIGLYDLADDLVYPVVSDESEILNFSLSRDGRFLVYNSSPGEVFLVHIPTRLKVLILNDKAVFNHQLSADNRFCSFEKSNQTSIMDMENFIESFGLDSVFRISLGMKDGLKNGMSVEVYEEKRNPFTQKVIGYDENGFKGVLKIISVFHAHSYGIQQEEESTDKPFQPGDAVLWKEKNVTGSIE